MTDPIGDVAIDAALPDMLRHRGLSRGATRRLLVDAASGEGTALAALSCILPTQSMARIGAYGLETPVVMGGGAIWKPDRLMLNDRRMPETLAASMIGRLSEIVDHPSMPDRIVLEVVNEDGGTGCMLHLEERITTLASVFGPCRAARMTTGLRRRRRSAQALASAGHMPTGRDMSYGVLLMLIAVTAMLLIMLVVSGPTNPPVLRGAWPLGSLFLAGLSGLCFGTTWTWVEGWTGPLSNWERSNRMHVRDLRRWEEAVAAARNEGTTT